MDYCVLLCLHCCDCHSSLFSRKVGGSNESFCYYCCGSISVNCNCSFLFMIAIGSKGENKWLKKITLNALLKGFIK